MKKPPINRLFNYFFMFVITCYQKLLSPFLGKNCRFYPSCSAYAKESFSKHSFFYALKLTINRIMRCTPWNKGGFDPVPEKKASKNKDN